MEWIKLAGTILFVTAGIFVACISVFGIFRFKFALNRMHSAALMDTLAITFILTGLIIYNGFQASSFKLLLIIMFLWCASPVSSHLIARFEVTVDEKKVREECEEIDIGRKK